MRSAVGKSCKNSSTVDYVFREHFLPGFKEHSWGLGWLECQQQQRQGLEERFSGRNLSYLLLAHHCLQGRFQILSLHFASEPAYASALLSTIPLCATTD